MKTKFSKVVSLFMSAIMTVSALTLPGFSANAETNESTEQTINTNDSEIQYGGLFGSMLSDEIGESVENSQEAASQDYAVYKLYHDPQTKYIGVDYHAKNDCTLFLGFYNDEGTELITSVNKELKAEDRGFAEMYVNDVLPEYYLIKAFIIGSELINPLSQPCVYNKCTKQMKEILSKTISNFDEEKDNVVNLDEDEKNNFLVLQDDVIKITSTENSDKYVGEDEKGNYVFENAVEIAKLQKGNKVFVNTSPEKIAFTVDSIEIDGSKAVISYTTEEMDSYIKFLKFNSDEYTGEKNTDNSESNADTEERKQLPQPFSPQADSDDPFALQFPTIKSEFDIDISKKFCYKDTWELKAEKKDGNNAVKAFGSLTLTISGCLEIYYEPHIFSDDYLSVQFDYSIEAIANAGLAFTKTFPLSSKITVFSFEGLATIFFTPSITISATGQALVHFKKEYTNSFDPINGLISSSSEPALMDLDGNIKIDILLNGKFELNTLGITIFDVTLSAGLRITIKSDDPYYLYSETGTIKGNEFYDIILESPEKYIRHDCNDCVNVDVNFIAQATCSFTFKPFGIEILDLCHTITFPYYEKPIGSWHRNENEKGKGKCTNYSHKISFTVTSEKGNKPINNVQFYISSKNQNEKLITWDDGRELSTFGEGHAEFFVKDSLLTDKTCRIKAVASTGEYAICNVGALFNKKKKGEYNFKVKIDLENEESLTDDDTDDTEEDNDDEEEEKKEVKSITGICGGGNNGGNVFFVIYPDENNLDADIPYQDVCYIYGNGEINQSHKIPSWVKKVVVIDPETKLSQGSFGGRAFESIDLSVMQTIEIPESTFQTCSNLIEVILPPNTETIGALAFNQCSRLEYVYLPDSITSIGQAAFSNSAIKSFTAPKNLKEIGFEAFKFTNLREIKLNDGLQFISLAAFMGKSIKYLNIPSSVNVIALHAFRDWDQLTTVIINSDFDAVDVDHDNSSLVNHQFIKYYDNLSDWIFEGCYNIKEVTFNEGVTTINPSIFQCKYNLEKVNFPSTLKTIGREAFLTTNLTDVNIPESVTSIGYQAFFKSRYYKTGGKTIELKPFKSITINNPNCEIGESIVPSGSDVIVYGHDGSTAQAFAVANSNTFISLDAPVTTTSVATTTTTKATTVVTTNITPDKECVMVAVNDTINENTSASRILNSDDLRFFDQNTADENGVVSFAYVPNNDETWSFMFISEAVDNIVQKTFGAINDLKTVSEPLISDDTETLSTVSGDANGDGTVDMADAVLIMQALANPNKYGLDGTDPRHITENGLKYADTDGDGLTVNDAQHIQLYLLGKISSLG